MRKAIALGMAAVMGLSLTACGGSSEQNSAQPTEKTASAETTEGAGEKTDLTLWLGSWWEETAPTIKEDFEKAYPQYNLTIDCLPINGYFDNAATAILSGDPPDILDIDVMQTSSFAAKGLLTDLTDNLGTELNRDEFLTPAWDASMYDGKVFGIPSRGTGGLYYYNKDMFDKAGVEYPTDDWTYETMLEMAQKITGDGVYGMGISGDPSDQGNFFTVFAPMLWYYGGEFFNEDYTKCTMDSPEAVQAITYWSELLTKYKVCPEGTLNYTIARDIIPMLNQGQVAIMASGTGALATFDKNPDLKYGTVQYPKGLCRAGGWTFTIPSTAKNVNGAKDFIRWFSQAEVQAKVCDATEPSVIKAWTLSEKWSTDQNIQFLEGAKTGKTLPSVGYWGECATIIMTELQKVLQEQMTPEEGAASITSQINAIIK